MLLTKPMKSTFLILIFFLSAMHPLLSQSLAFVEAEVGKTSTNEIPFLVVLGTIQDGGSPHIGCKKKCCSTLFSRHDPNRKVVSIGVIDPKNEKKFLIECSPDFPTQAKKLLAFSPFTKNEIPDGIFLTHAHIGHYTGLMYLGKEAINSKETNVYVMPRMKQFIENNGPWSQLVSNHNIVLNPLDNNKKIQLSSNISMTPILVPHRDEYSETVGYIIEGTSKKVLFIPDIDKWDKWDRQIVDIIKIVDMAFIDGTFYDGQEINTRDITKIPHPFIIESMHIFKDLAIEEKQKIHFIHFNHTNPVLDSTTEESKSVRKNGFRIARMNQIVKI
jgi:pyrroloquinoline quinone biosynthesis protein B